MLGPNNSAFLLGALSLATLSFQYRLAVLVELQFGDDYLRWCNADADRLTVNLLAGDALDVHDVFETVDRCDLALTTLQSATSDNNLVVLANGDGADLFAARTMLGTGA